MGIYEADSGEGIPSPEDYRKLPSKNVREFEKVMKNMIIELCDLACRVYYHKYIQRWTLEQMVNKKKDAEQGINMLY